MDILRSLTKQLREGANGHKAEQASSPAMKPLATQAR